MALIDQSITLHTKILSPWVSPVVSDKLVSSHDHRRVTFLCTFSGTEVAVDRSVPVSYWNTWWMSASSTCAQIWYTRVKFLFQRQSFFDKFTVRTLHSFRASLHFSFLWVRNLQGIGNFFPGRISCVLLGCNCVSAWRITVTDFAEVHWTQGCTTNAMGHLSLVVILRCVCASATRTWWKTQIDKLKKRVRWFWHSQTARRVRCRNQPLPV